MYAIDQSKRIDQLQCTIITFKYFRPGIPGPDSLSTLSTATELLQLLMMPSNTLGALGKAEATTADTESSAMETGIKEEETKVETESGGDKVEEMNIDVEGKDSKDQQSKNSCKKGRIWCKWGKTILGAIICTIFRLGAYGEFVNEPPLYSRKIHVSVREFQELMKTKKENGESEHPLETLEALLEVNCATAVESRFLGYVESRFLSN